MTKDNNNFEVFTTHSFMYNLYLNNEAKGKKIVYISKENKEEEVIIDSIDLGPSSLKCKIKTDQNQELTLPFIRIRKVFDGDEMIWDNSQTDLSNIKVIPRD